MTKLGESIINSLQQALDWTRGKGEMAVTIANQRSVMLSMDELLVAEMLSNQEQAWTFDTYAQTMKAVEIGRKVWPDGLWQWMYIEPSERKSNQKPWVVTYQ